MGNLIAAYGPEEDEWKEHDDDNGELEEEEMEDPLYIGPEDYHD